MATQMVFLADDNSLIGWLAELDAFQSKLAENYGSHVYLHIRGLVTLTCPLFMAFWKLSACHGQPFSSSFGSVSQLLCFKDFMKNNTTVTIGTGERCWNASNNDCLLDLRTDLDDPDLEWL
ncbi:unnamed protein product [Citrullus colocynthis]|uniref:Uncharacterized protein n=1 Tax=Citrullus colocynthis TaxID=252529 RepID=A0ABP0YHS1_9ROSI